MFIENKLVFCFGKRANHLPGSWYAEGRASEGSAGHQAVTGASCLPTLPALLSSLDGFGMSSGGLTAESNDV